VLSAAEREQAAQALLGAARDHATIPPVSVTTLTTRPSGEACHAASSRS